MADLPKTYRAAVFEKPNGGFVLRERELKMPERGQVLLKVQATGVCHSDGAVEAGMMSELPRVAGHEIAGKIVAVGEGEKRWKVGDTAGGGWHGGADQSCKACQRGRPVLCKNQEVNGVSFDGGYAEYVLLKSDAVVKLPEDMDPAEVAPLLCAGITTFNSLRNSDVPAGGTVAVSGLGGLGHLAIQYSSKMGYRTVALSSSADKKDFAMQLGAHDYIDGSKEDTNARLQEMGGADLIVCTAPSPKVIEPLVGGLAPGGTLMLIAIAGKITLDTLQMVPRGTKMVCWASGASLDSEECVAFSRLNNVRCLIERFKLDDAQQAWERMTSGKARFRAVIVM